MKPSRWSKIVLFIAGLIAAGVGASILLAPVAFNAASGITLGDNINLLNETRASGGALLASSILILCGVFIARLAYTAALISTVLYGGYGLSRLLSMALDGLPDAGLIQVTILELAIGFACLFVLVKTEWFKDTRQAAS